MVGLSSQIKSLMFARRSDGSPMEMSICAAPFVILLSDFFFLFCPTEGGPAILSVSQFTGCSAHVSPPKS